jgi:hypothetical protein
MKDIYWVLLRQVLQIGGTALSVKYGIPAAEVGNIIDLTIAAAGASAALGSAGWGLYVRFRTRAVPERVAARADVPTVSAATGAVER